MMAKQEGLYSVTLGEMVEQASDPFYISDRAKTIGQINVQPPFIANEGFIQAIVGVDDTGRLNRGPIVSFPLTTEESTVVIATAESTDQKRRLKDIKTVSARISQVLNNPGSFLAMSREQPFK